MKSLFITLFLVSYNLVAQTRIDISYDASGNRTIKKITGRMPDFKVDAFNNNIWAGQAANIFAHNCTNGTITWSNGITGGGSSSISVTPASSTNYTATCITANCPTTPIKRYITVKVNECVQNGVLGNNQNDNFTMGNIKVEVSDKITANNKISGGTITYDAGKSIEFKPGFEAKGNVSFKAIIDGCK